MRLLSCVGCILHRLIVDHQQETIMDKLAKLKLTRQTLMRLEYEFESTQIKLKHHLSPVVKEVEAAFRRQEAYNRKLKKLLKRKIELEIKLKHHLSPVVKEVEAAFRRQEAYNRKLKKLLKRKIELEVGLKYIKDQAQKAIGL